MVMDACCSLEHDQNSEAFSCETYS